MMGALAPNLPGHHPQGLADGTAWHQDNMVSPPPGQHGECVVTMGHPHKRLRSSPGKQQQDHAQWKLPGSHTQAQAYPAAAAMAAQHEPMMMEEALPASGGTGVQGMMPGPAAATASHRSSPAWACAGRCTAPPAPGPQPMEEVAHGGSSSGMMLDPAAPPHQQSALPPSFLEREFQRIAAARGF
jgi:hypothetical protein